MPLGKPAGMRCANLDDANHCRIWGLPEYPEVCRKFQAQRWVCGETRDEALALIARLESQTDPTS